MKPSSAGPRKANSTALDQGWGRAIGVTATADDTRPNSVLMVAGMGHMSGLAELWSPGFDPAHGILVLPLWSVAVTAALFAAYCVFVLIRAGHDGIGEAFSRAGLLLVGGAVAWVV